MIAQHKKNLDHQKPEKLIKITSLQKMEILISIMGYHNRNNSVQSCRHKSVSSLLTGKTQTSPLPTKITFDSYCPMPRFKECLKT